MHLRTKQIRKAKAKTIKRKKKKKKKKNKKRKAKPMKKPRVDNMNQNDNDRAPPSRSLPSNIDHSNTSDDDWRCVWDWVNSGDTAERGDDVKQEYQSNYISQQLFYFNLICFVSQ
eukprot:495344_1